MFDPFYKYIRRLACWHFLLISGTPLQAQPLLTLEEVVQRVIVNNFDIQIARNEQKITVKNHHIGQAGFLPVLDTNVGMNATYSTWPKKPNANTVNASVDLGIKWTVFNGMQRIATYQHLGKLKQISQLEVQQKIEEKVAEAIISYYGLSLAQKKKNVLDNGLVISREVLQLARVKYEIGQCSKLEYLNAQVQHNEEQIKILFHQELLTTAKFFLHRLMGGKGGPEDFSVVEDIPLSPRLSRDSIAKSLTTSNSSILVAQKYCEDAALAIKMQQSKLWPHVHVALGYDLGRKCHNQRWETTPRGLRYGISASLNLFNAFRHTTAIQEVGMKADNRQLNLQAQKLQLEYELKKYFLIYTQCLQRYELAQQHVQVSQENMAASLEQYRLGSITLLALDKAKQSAQEAVLKYWQVRHDAKVAEVMLHKLGGTLLDAAY
jgi:outer membrane protein